MWMMLLHLHVNLNANDDDDTQLFSGARGTFWSKARIFSLVDLWDFFF